MNGEEVKQNALRKFVVADKYIIADCLEKLTVCCDQNGLNFVSFSEGSEDRLLHSETYGSFSFLRKPSRTVFHLACRAAKKGSLRGLQFFCPFYYRGSSAVASLNHWLHAEGNESRNVHV